MQITRRRAALVMSLTLTVMLTLGVINPITLNRAAAQGKQPTLTFWTKFNDQSPQNSQDEWLAAALKEYKAATGNDVTNVDQPYDQINSKLNVAVQSGGDVPDLSYVDSQQLGFFTQNGTLQDLTDYVKNAAWFKDITPAALATCTTPDGKILCVPTSVGNSLIYYWKDQYPNGFPATTDKFLAAAKDLKAKGKFAITIKGSESISFDQAFFGLITSFGGKFVDKNGKAIFASKETVAALQFARDLFVNKYAPEVDLAPGFDDEESFKSGDAASFSAGSWSYVYLEPLTAPDGTKIAKKSGSVEAAYDAGKLDFAPPLAAPNGKPASLLVGTALSIPKGAKNVAAAKAWIDFEMTSARNAAFAASYGALPSLVSAQSDKAFQAPYWVAVAKYQKDYALPAPAFVEYDRATKLLSDTYNKIMADPTVDIAAELKKAQDDYNNGIGGGGGPAPTTAK